MCVRYRDCRSAVDCRRSRGSSPTDSRSGSRRSRLTKPGNPGKVAIDVATWSGVELEAVIAEAKQHVRSFDKDTPKRRERSSLEGRGASRRHRAADSRRHGAPIGEAAPHRRCPRRPRARIAVHQYSLGARPVACSMRSRPSLLPTRACCCWYQQTSTDLLRIALACRSRRAPAARAPALPVRSGAAVHERSSARAVLVNLAAGGRRILRCQQPR